MNILQLIGRTEPLFSHDIERHEAELRERIGTSSFLVIGGAGSIGQAVTRELFKRNPRKLHVVDISENNLVELVRDLRSTLGYTDGDFRTFALDAGSDIFTSFYQSDGQYDYVLNLSALKHVRSEKDPFTLMRMVDVNVFNTVQTLRLAKDNGARKYFCVSTDKAANPVNMMGASKRIMELFLMRESLQMPVSMARFANVAFSDGSLLHGFNQRILKKQPIVAPNDVKRYFVTPQESGELCMMSCLFGENRDIYFPKLSEQLHLITFSEIAGNYLAQLGYTPYLCETEEEAREAARKGTPAGTWPCLFTPSDTTGEKDFEEFYTGNETLDMETYRNLGVIKNEPVFDEDKLEEFVSAILAMRKASSWTKEEMVNLFNRILPGFQHLEKGKFLDAKM